MYMLKLGKILDRNLNNPNLKINKDLIMKTLKISYTNSTFLKKIQKQNQEIENELKKLGINADPYRILAQYVIRKEHDQYRKLID